MRLIIASRKSDLARVQALSVGDALRTSRPGLEIEFNFRESLGDKNLNDPLWKMPERGVFTEDFYHDLVDGRCDMVVHSWKDLPVEPRTDTEIVATMQRADMRDVLLMRRDRWAKARETGTVKIFSSSPRRAYNLSAFLQDALPARLRTAGIIFEPVRGNVPTRIEKLFSNDVDGLIVAKAALDRLLAAPWPEFSNTQKQIRARLGQCLFMVLPLQLNPTAAAQGALAIEIKKGRDDLRELLLTIHDSEAFAAVQREREILTSYGGGCHQKVGVSVLKREYGEILFVRALPEGGTAVERFEFTPGGECATAGSSVETSSRVISGATLMAPRTEDLRHSVRREVIYPLEMKNEWFDREPLNVSELPRSPLWVTKSDALPESLTAPLVMAAAQGQVVWASGLETFKKLARRGVWVSGSSESLGENENPRLSQLLNGEPQWIKLTHDEGVSRDGMRVLATYRLVPRKDIPDLRGKTHFYWASGSTFLRALEVYPEIKHGQHFCGPGNTKTILEQNLGKPVSVFPNYKIWLNFIAKT